MEARYTAGRNPGTGRQIQRSIYGATQQEVAKELRKVTAAIDNGTYMQPTTWTVKQWLEKWQAEYLNDVKSYTQKSYETQARVYIIPAIGAT